MNSELLDQTPSHNLEAERAVIGGVLLKPSIFVDMNLDAMDFHDEQHQGIWRAWQTLAEDGGEGRGAFLGGDPLVFFEHLGVHVRRGGRAAGLERLDALVEAHHVLLDAGRSFSYLFKRLASC